jgi:hypothetical protein
MTVCGHLDVEPADLRPRGADRGPTRCLDEQLRAEADRHHRRSALEQLTQERLLARQPSVLGLLVGVHRAAEGEHAVVAERVGRRTVGLGPIPKVEGVARLGDGLAEHARPGFALV